MKVTNKSEKIRICTFLHYSVSEELPYYVQIYIRELSNYFDKVVVVSNNKNLQKQNLSLSENIDFEYFENRGYDFGLFYRFVKTQNLNDFSQIAIVNDSNILINKLDAVFQKGKQSNADFWGLIDSNEKPWFSTHTDNYHLQSHFVVLNEKAIRLLPSFFEQMEVDILMNETDLKKVRRMVINQWEIGISQFLIGKDLKSYVFIDSFSFLNKYKSKGKNITHSLYKELIKEGYPLIKKKVILEKSWRSLFRKKQPWEELLFKIHENSDWNISLMLDEVKNN